MYQSHNDMHHTVHPLFILLLFITILCTKKQLNNVWSICKCGNTKIFLETKWLLIWIILTKADKGKTSYIKEQNHNSLLRLDGNKQLRPNHDTWWCPPSN